MSCCSLYSWVLMMFWSGVLVLTATRCRSPIKFSTDKVGEQKKGDVKECNGGESTAWSLCARCRGQNSHPLSRPLNCFTHFGSRLVNEPPRTSRWLSAHGALCPFISLLCASFRESQITAPLCTLCKNTYTAHGCGVWWDIRVTDLWSALLITDGYNCCKRCYLDFFPSANLRLLISRPTTAFQVSPLFMAFSKYSVWYWKVDSKTCDGYATIKSDFETIV